MGCVMLCSTVRCPENRIKGLLQQVLRCQGVVRCGELAPGDMTVGADQQDTVFGDFHHFAPIAVEILVVGRTDYHGAQERLADRLCCLSQTVPASPVSTVNLPLPTTSSVEMRRPVLPTSHAWGSLAPGRVVGWT